MLPFVLTIASSRKRYFLRKKWNLWQKKNILTSHRVSKERQQIIGETRRWSWNKRSSLASSTKTLNLIRIAGDKLPPPLLRNSLQTFADPGAGEKSNNCLNPKCERAISPYPDHLRSVPLEDFAIRIWGFAFLSSAGDDADGAFFFFFFSG